MGEKSHKNTRANPYKSFKEIPPSQSPPQSLPQSPIFKIYKFAPVNLYILKIYMTIAQEDKLALEKMKTDYEKEQKLIEKFSKLSARKSKEYNAFLKKYRDTYAELEKIYKHLDTLKTEHKSLETDQDFDKKQILEKMGEINSIIELIT